MKKLIYSISVYVVLSACNSGGGGGAAVPTKPLGEQLAEAQSATDFSASIVPEKFTVTKADLSYEEQKEMYGIGCKTEGEPSWDPYKMDPALRAGLMFKSKEGRSELLDLDTFQTLEKTIASVEGQKIVTELNFLEANFGASLFTSIDQIFYRKPHVTTTSNYKEGATDSDFSYVANYTPAALEYLQSIPSNGSYLSCSVSWSPTTPSQSSTDKIMYPLSGRQVVAYLKKRIEAGEIVCSKRNFGQQDSKSEEIKMGLGHRETIEIVSNDVIHESTISCGGRELFHMSKMVLDSGKVVSTDVRKVLEAPLR